MERRHRNLTVIEGKNNSPIYDGGRRNTAAPYFQSSQTEVQPTASVQEQDQAVEGNWSQTTEEHLPGQENYNWYEQYDEYGGYQQGWDEQYEGQDQAPEEYYQQDERVVEGDTHEEEQYAEDYHEGDYDYGYGDSTEQYPDTEGGDGYETVEHETEVAEYAATGTEEGDGVEDDAGHYDITVNSAVLTNASSSATADELALKLRGQDLLLTQSLHQLTLLEQEKASLEQKWATEMAEISSHNQQLREDASECVRQNKLLEERLRKAVEEISEREEQIRRVEDENYSHQVLVEEQRCENKVLERDIEKVRQEMRALNESYQVRHSVPPCGDSSPLDRRKKRRSIVSTPKRPPRCVSRLRRSSHLSHLQSPPPWCLLWSTHRSSTRLSSSMKRRCNTIAYAFES
jgi:hypothetical protein